MSLNLRRIAIKSKQIAGIAYSQPDYDHIYVSDLMRSQRFTDVRLVNSEIEVVLLDGTSLRARRYPHSDCGTLRQVFVDGEYDPVVSIFVSNGLPGKGLKVIDAGANVGYTSAFLFANFPDSEIVCVEPDSANSRLLRANLKTYVENGRLTVLEMGLMNEDDMNLSVNRDFRDGKDHAIAVEASDSETGLKSISIQRIMQDRSWDRLDILKMDIEGAERFVFGKDADVSFLENAVVVAIEIHDEFNIRGQIHSVLHEYGFVLFESRETTFGVNQRFLGPSLKRSAN